MPSISGEFRGAAPYVRSSILIGGEIVARLALLVDTGAAHVVVVLPSPRLSPALYARITGWPVEVLHGLGTLPAYRGDSVMIELADASGNVIAIPFDTIHIILYDPTEDMDIQLAQLPPSLLGFQHGAFGMSQLLIDNANQRVSLTYQEPFTPTRLE